MRNPLFDYRDIEEYYRNKALNESHPSYLLPELSQQFTWGSINIDGKELPMNDYSHLIKPMWDEYDKHRFKAYTRRREMMDVFMGNLDMDEWRKHYKVINEISPTIDSIVFRDLESDEVVIKFCVEEFYDGDKKYTWKVYCVNVD